MAAHSQDSRTVLQSHKLRTDLTAKALIHGDGGHRGRTVTVRVLLISLILAAVIVVGIVATGFIIDMIAARRR